MSSETQRTWSLTEIQRAYYVGRQESRDGTRILYEFRCADPVEIMEKALNRLVSEQAALQLVFTRDGRQKLAEEAGYYHIETVDLSGLSAEEAEDLVRRDFNRTSKENYDIFRWPLFSMKAFLLPQGASNASGEPGPAIVYQFGIDMMIADASSLHFLIHRVVEYAQERNWIPAEMDRSFLDYCDEKERERSEEEGGRAKDRAFWMKKLGTFPGPPDFPPSRKRGGRRSYARKELEVSSAKWEALLERIRSMQLTPSAFLLGAYAHVVGIYSGQSEFALNLPVFDRMGIGGTNAVGDFTAILLVPVSMGESGDFVRFCKKLQFRMIDALRHRRFSGLEFMREIARDRETGTFIYPVVFTSMVNEEQHLDIDEKKYEMTRGYSQTSQVILDCQIMANRNRLYVFWDYDRDAFAEGLIDRMFRHFCALVTDDGQALQSLEEEKKAAWDAYEVRMQLPEEHAGLLGADLPVHARRNPEAPAVIDANGVEETYAGLEKAVERIAAGLQALGIRRGDGIMVPAVKTVENIAAILAVLRCGAFYVPYMPGTPEGRFEDMKTMSGACMVLTEDKCADLLQNHPGDSPAAFCPVVVEPTDMAYIIFTSGSTGKPKGVMITHGQAWNTIRDINTRFHVDRRDRILGISELTFDLSVYDLFGAIQAGAAVVYTRNHHEMKEIRRQISDRGITIWNSVPALMSLVLGTEEEPLPYYRDFYHEEKTIPRKIRHYGSLRLVMLSGDYIPVSLPDQIRKTWPQSEVISLGGATEGSIWSIFYPIEKVDRQWTTIPYGYPLSGQTMYILDREENPAPPATVGEICIGGAGVALGYAGSRDLTDSAFIVHPALGRIYRTGDYGMLTAEGYIEFLGRRDQQVKINGYRVELDEISSKALQMDGVANAVALSAGAGGKVLNLYYTTEKQVERKALEAFLEKELLPYMVPRNLYEVRQIPLTANGKVDRRALMALVEEESGSGTVPPSGEKEEKIFSLFCKVLGRDDFGVEDDFFDLGGDSLKGIELFNLLEQDYEVTLAQLFQFRTVRSLAGQIEERDEFEDRLAGFRRKLDAATESAEDEKALDALEEEALSAVEKTAPAAAGQRTAEREQDQETGRQYRGILLTGATGYLGAYLVRDLLKRTDAVLHLLVRGNEPERKLRDNLTYYFGPDFMEKAGPRIRIWKGEMSLPDQGMTAEMDQALWSGVDAVFHCGAKTTHYGKPEEFRKVNVDSTELLLEKCLARRADFFFVSSTRVLDNDVTDRYQIFDETARADCFRARELYSDSKIQSEKLIEKYREKGVRCMIFRTGTIVFDSVYGLIQRNHEENAFYIVLRAFRSLQFIPDLAKKALDFSYVDKVAEAMVTLLLRAPANGTYHIFNPARISAGELGRRMNSAGLRTPLTCISPELMMERMQNENAEKRRIMELAILHTSSYIPASSSKSRVVCDRTAGLLRRFGFTWPAPDEAMIRKLVRIL